MKILALQVRKYYIPSSFVSYLSNNRLKVIPHGVFEELPSLVTMYVAELQLSKSRAMHGVEETVHRG